MRRSRKQCVWVVAALATLVGQGAPQACGPACDQPCCAQQTDGGDSTADFACAPAGGCPLCAAATDLRPTEVDGRPCHCQLNARHEQPLSPPKGAPAAFAAGDPAVAQVAIPPLAPPVLGVSRDYLAASLAMPIRPPRILFGVWRN